MKLCRMISALALVTLLVMTVAAQEKHSPIQPNAGTSGAPLLVIESLTHDFGEVKAGTPLRYAFIVKNRGKADLLINNVAPG